MGGDAAQTPFLGASFDLVISRLAVHHFQHPAHQIGEMARVCRPDGRFAVIDLVACDGELAASQNRIERLRDPSHARALAVGELRGLLEHAGLSVIDQAHREEPISVERWLSQAQTPSEVGLAITGELDAELHGGAPTGMRPVLREGKLCHTQRWAVFLAEKPSTPTGG